MNPIKFIMAIMMALLIQPAFPEDDDFISYLKQEAYQGDAEAQYNLGEAYYFGQGVLQNYKQAVHWYRMAADQGYVKAQYSLGVMYERRRGVPQDYKEAVRWYRLAADQGYAMAQYNLGVMYGKGEGVPQDYVSSHMWMNLAASQATGKVREDSIHNRDVVEKKMTRQQIAEAQRLAREFKPNPSEVTKRLQ